MVQPDEFQARLKALEELRGAGIDPYPPRSHPTATSAQVREMLAEREGDRVTVAGRIVGGIRPMGKLAFVHIQDGSGRIQLSFQRPVVGEEAWALFKLLHAGDFVEAEGETFHTKTGEPTVRVERLTLLSKSLRPLPDKHSGLEDTELRYRQRYLDLLVNEESRRLFTIRSRFISFVRRFLDARGFLEVETPVLQPLYGGGHARPFTTYFNALDEQLYLRIALELYLKRLIIGGIDRVYEIGRNFRNEGFSRFHSPEYTMLEVYQAYADYTHMMEITEQMVAGAAQEILGTTTVTYDGHTIDLQPPWSRLSMLDAIHRYSGIRVEMEAPAEHLRAAAADKGVVLPEGSPRAVIIDELVKRYVEPNLIEPTHLTDYPVEISPLAKRRPDNPDLVERFESYIAGVEIANAFTELNDPIDQRLRFEQQQANRAHGDAEAHTFDEDFLLAMEHGMPPTGGLGVGIDRVTMVLGGAHTIRDVILFPHMRRDEGRKDA